MSNILYDVGGAIRSYSLASSPAVNVEYFRTAPEQLPNSSCSFDPGGSDGSGRLAALKVSRTGSNLFLRKYGWKADQISGQATCVLDDPQPVNEEFLYDPMLQLLSGTRPTGEHASLGGPYQNISYEYEKGTTRVREHTGNDWWSLEYDEFGRLSNQRPRSSSDWKDTSWYRRAFEHDADGRTVAIDETPILINSTTIGSSRYISLEPDNGVGSVYRAVGVNSAGYQYLYDAQGRRRLKVYPSGFTDEFFYLGDRLVEDRGLKTPLEATNVIDQYVWLGSQPLALVRESMNEYFELTGDTHCARNDEDSPCGTFYVISDYLPKPVALINSNGQLAGVGEYDPFGRVNTVSIRADAPALEPTNPQLSPFGMYRPSMNGAMVSFAQPARTASQRVRARVNYAQVNTARAADRTWVADVFGQPLTPYYSGAVGPVQTPWFPIEFEQGVEVWWTSNATMPKRYGGATTATYEYQRYEYGADPVWMSLRYPGQYADEETGLFENRNRFYDPALGSYLAADPYLTTLTPPLNPVEPLEVYGYARNNPVMRSDSTGLAPDDLVKAWQGRMLMGAGVDSPSHARLQLIEAVMRGDWNRAASLASALGGAAPTAVRALQAAFDKANQVAGPCYRVSTQIFDGFKALGKDAVPMFIRTGSSNGPGGFIGRRVVDELGKERWITVATNGEHAVIESGGRYYDAFTGPAGQLASEYMSNMTAGHSAFPLKVF